MYKNNLKIRKIPSSPQSPNIKVANKARNKKRVTTTENRAVRLWKKRRWQWKRGKIKWERVEKEENP